MYQYTQGCFRCPPTTLLCKINKCSLKRDKNLTKIAVKNYPANNKL